MKKKKTGKWLADTLKKGPATVSKWCTNVSQPSISTFIEIAKLLDIELTELFSKDVLKLNKHFED